MVGQQGSRHTSFAVVPRECTMPKKLNTASLSSQAQSEIMRIIKGMDLSVDNKLPREEALSEMLGVSRTTIRQALNNLASQGIVFRRQGKGTFVNVDSLGVRATFSPCLELTDAIRNSGYEPSVKMLSVHEVENEQKASSIRERLCLKPDDPVIEVDKLFCADGSPCALCRDQLGLSALGGKAGLEKLEHFEGSIFKLLYQQTMRRVEWDKAQIGVSSASEIANLGGGFTALELPQVAYLLVKTVNYDGDDKPMLIAYEFVDTSVITYSLIRQKSVDYSW